MLTKKWFSFHPICVYNRTCGVAVHVIGIHTAQYMFDNIMWSTPCTTVDVQMFRNNYTILLRNTARVSYKQQQFKYSLAQMEYISVIMP